ncbi:MAG: nucleoside-diphosphate kinase [Thermoguttaceae bacterium]|nr:nucleoside-diphosphate kinase [Thermoguttaceae bacterium]
MSNPNVETEKTFVMFKPDALERNLAGEIIGRLERKGLRLTKIELRTVSKELAALHYAEHLEKAFYPELEAYVTRGPVLATIWEGRKAITVVRGLLGATDSTKAAVGTIRGDFGFDATENLVHASDSPESAEREIGVFFGE